MQTPKELYTNLSRDTHLSVVIFSSILQCSMVCKWILSLTILIKNDKKNDRQPNLKFQEESQGGNGNNEYQNEEIEPDDTTPL